AAALVCGALWLVPMLRPEHVGATELAVLAFSIIAACLADAGYRFMLGCSRFRAHALVTAVTSWVYPLLAVILWAFFGLTIALGFYVVAVNLSEILLYFPGAVATALLPLAAQSAPVPRLAQTLKAFRSAAYVTLATLILSAVLGPPLIPLVFGSAFRASVT